MTMISKVCPHCGKNNQFEMSVCGDSFFCAQCGKEIKIEEVPDSNAAVEKLKISFSELAESPSSETEQNQAESGFSSEKIIIDFEPHVQTSVSSTTKGSSHHRSSITDLRNQVTMVAGSRQPTIIGTDGAGQPLQSTKVTFSLPFTAGDFLATDVLAQGGMSMTYIGHRLSDPEEKVVIKIPDVKSKKTVDMFSNECKILAELKHPNIVPILSFGEVVADGSPFPYMVMKFIDGQSLRQKIKVQGHLSWQEASKVLKDIAGALDYLYENNFCHRDIKPDNIIFDTASDSWILVDFGIAKSLQDNIMLTMTMAGQDSGTWDYMPPEQLDGKAVDIRCDIYALGTVIWESLIGTVPRRGTKLPSAFGLDLPSDVDILIGKMVEHNPADRYQTPGDLLEALSSGAGKIEKWKKRKSKLRIFTRYGLAGLLIVVALILIWFIGNFISIAKAREIYEQNKASATVTLRELNKAAAKMPFFWGRSYLDKVIPELKKQSDVERANMKSEFNGIHTKILQHSGSDEDLESRELLCKNFIAKWGKTFDGAEAITICQSNLSELSQILLRRKEERLLSSTIDKIKTITAAKQKAQYREAFDECRKVGKILTLPDIKKKLEDFVAALKKEAIGSAMDEVKALIASDSRKDWFTAYQKIDDIRETIGDDPQLTEEQSRIDDKFWQYYSSEAQRAMKENRFSNAREHLKQYEQSGMKRHTAEMLRFLGDINRAEEFFHWEETRKAAEQYMASNAFVPALDAVNRFAARYPNTQIIKIPEQRKAIANRFAEFIIKQRTDLDSFQENLKVFLEKFPDDRENIKVLRRFLCWSIHNAVGNIVFDESIVSEAKSARLAQIKYNDCEDYQKNYLKILLAVASNYAARSSIATLYGFEYYYQRPPADCVKMKDPPTIFDVTITKIKVDLSASHYSELKGMNNCNPEIRIGKEGYDPWWKVEGPANTYTFTLDKPYNFWWNIKDCKFKIQIADADDSPFDAGTCWGTLDPTAFKRSDSTSWKWNNGTTLEMEWTTK